MAALKTPLAFPYPEATQTLDVFGRVDSPPVFVPPSSRKRTEALSEAKPCSTYPKYMGGLSNGDRVSRRVHAARVK
jgi:hypothetical protein